jgi:Tol biopolymer transport system component
MEMDFDKVRGARFTHDGKSLVLNVFENGVSNLWLQPIGQGRRKQLTFFDSDQILDMDFSPDGKQIVLVRGRVMRDAVRISNTGKD